MASKDVIEKLKKLSPRERIEKLKEIQEKDKVEIEKAQELIRESEEQAAREEEVERIPIPQVKAVNIDNLFSSEEKELFKAKRLIGETPRTEEEATPTPQEEKLERIAEQAPKLTQEEAAAQGQYLNQLSQRPAEELENRMKNIYNQVKGTGKLSNEQKEEMNNIHYATQRKMEDIQAGKYTEVNKEIAQEMVLTEKMRSWVQDRYGRRTM